MGTKYEVNAWICENDEYRYDQKYAGEWLIVALLVSWKLKRAGCGCVKIEWR